MATQNSNSRRMYLGGSLLYAAIYLHYGITTPFLPVWYQHRGYSPDQISALLSLPMFLKLFVIAPILTFADRVRRVRDMIWCFIFSAAILLATMNVVEAFAAMLAVTAAFAVFWDTMPVLADAYCVSAARDQNLDFGRMRLWGSVAFVAANVLSGFVIERIGAQRIVWLAVACLSLPLVVLPFLPRDSEFQGARPAAAREWRTLMKNRGLLLMIASVSLIMASHGLLNNFSSVHWLQSGLSSTMVGALWGVSISAEVVLLYFGRRLLGNYPPGRLVLIGGCAAAARWVLMSLDPPLGLLFPIQILQGLSGIAPILAMMIYIERNIAPHLIASAQGLYAPAWSAALALATLASGPLWRLYGVHGYYVMALIAAVGAIVALLAMHEHAPPMRLRSAMPD
jgi:MFS transporter, PPP family, 3-phenylpropionic acid transporter